MELTCFVFPGSGWSICAALLSKKSTTAAKQPASLPPSLSRQEPPLLPHCPLAIKMWNSVYTLDMLREEPDKT